MAERNDPVTHGELVEIIRRLDDRISTLDRNTNQSLAEMRADIRMLTRFVMGSYAMMIGVAGALFTLYKMFPNP